MSKAASLVCNFDSHTNAFPQNNHCVFMRSRSISHSLPSTPAHTLLKRCAFQGPRATPGAHLGSEGGKHSRSRQIVSPDGLRCKEERGRVTASARPNRRGREKTTAIWQPAGLARAEASNGLYDLEGGVKVLTLKCRNI